MLDVARLQCSLVSLIGRNAEVQAPVDLVAHVGALLEVGLSCDEPYVEVLAEALGRRELLAARRRDDHPFTRPPRCTDAGKAALRRASAGALAVLEVVARAGLRLVAVDAIAGPFWGLFPRHLFSIVLTEARRSRTG